MKLFRSFVLVLSVLFLISLPARAEEATPAEKPAEEAAAEESPLTFDLKVAFFSDYMFRGFNLYDGASIQPSVTANYSFGDYGVLSGNYWMHLSADGDQDVQSFTESDETISYSLAIGSLSLVAGHAWYTYPRSADEINDTAEFFTTFSYDTLLTPTVSVFYDYREYDAFYYELSFSHTIETDSLGSGFAVTPFVAFGFASSAESLYDDNGLVHVTEGISTDLPLGDITVTPMLAYTHKVDDFTVNEFWFGMTMGYSF